MRRAILVHGYGGRPDGGWFSLLRRNLENEGFAVEAPEMPDSLHPKLDAWLQKLKETIQEPDEETILVGFSLGTITVLRYLERLHVHEIIGGVVLVSGTDQPLGHPYEELTHFAEDPVNFEIVKQRSKAFAVIHGSDDTIVPAWRGKDLAKKLDVQLTTVDDVGHFDNMKAMREAPKKITEAIMKMAIS